MSGIEKGVALSENPTANGMVAYLRNNVFAFSAAKTFSEQEILSKLLLRSNGSVKPYAEFKRDAQAAIKDFNTGYLQAEYNHAIAAAQMAEKWRTLQANKINFPYLQYRTVRDNRVREEHAALEGIILSIDSPVWDMIYPPNGWNCRCDVIPSKGDGKVSNEAEVGKEAKATVEPFFKNNVGKTGVVYEDGMPMFKNIKGNIQDLDPVHNYNLTIPNKKDMPSTPPMQTVSQYMQWWNSMVVSNKAGVNDFIIKDVLGTEVKFTAPENGFNDKKFRDHILRKGGENRYEYVHNVAKVLQEPDEVFTQKFRGKMTTVYIKYYKEAPLVLLVENNMNGTIAETMYKVDADHAGFHAKKRRGILLYKKAKI
jgi:SPP1 gp7 family putative phage head morphogenesis protein